jgi:hypothetical protein
LPETDRNKDTSEFKLFTIKWLKILLVALFLKRVTKDPQPQTKIANKQNKLRGF